MKISIPLLFISGISAALLGACSVASTQPMQPRTSVEAVERQGQNVQPNLNHGQHEAGYNAVRYSNPHDHHGCGGHHHHHPHPRRR